MAMRRSTARAFAAVESTVLRKILRQQIKRDAGLAERLERLLVAYRNGALDDPGAGFTGWIRILLVQSYHHSTEQYFHSLMRVHRIAMKQVPAPVWRDFRSRGMVLQLNLVNVAEWAMYVLGEHDRGVGYWLDQFVDEHTVFVDIGANIGIFTQQVANAMVNGGQVFAFEPNPKARSRLIHGLTESGLADRAEVYAYGLSDQSGDMILSVPAGNEGGATLEPAAEADTRVRVEVIRFDDWWRAAGKPRVSLVKIDVEGHELAVLRGMREMLQALQPVLIVEVTFSGSDRHAFAEFMAELGYRVREIRPAPPYARPLVISGSSRLDVLCEPGECT